MRRRDRVKILAVAFGLSLLLGCGDSNLANRAEVSGTVSLDGAPVESGTISFYPTGKTAGPTSGATIEKGAFHINRAQGPAAGENIVRFSGTRKSGRKIEGDFGRMEDEYVDVFPLKYGAESKEISTLKPGNNVLKFEFSTK